MINRAGKGRRTRAHTYVLCVPHCTKDDAASFALSIKVKDGVSGGGTKVKIEPCFIPASVRRAKSKSRA